jgi:hypothetical protein
MNIETITGVNSGGYRITDIIDGRYISRLYLGYTKQKAIWDFKKNITK